MRRLPFLLVGLVVCGCSEDPQIPRPLEATSDESLVRVTPSVKYEIIKLDWLGGPTARGSGINDAGWVAGYSDTSGARHAVLWRDGLTIDLGTLGGPSSNVQWPGINDDGMIVGISQTSTPDTLGETWSCSAFIPYAGKTCVGFVYDNGVMTALPTLGGDNGFAAGVNNRGQVVGWAENTVRDSTCRGTQKLQFHAVMWEPRTGRVVELHPATGHSASAATAINDSGQVVGISGECDVAVGRFSARRSVMWEDGNVKELPDLGGVSWHTPMAINNRGDVVGFSNPPGDADGRFIARAFLWTGGKSVTDLGTLKGDATSQARGLNRWRQVVGVSSGPNGTRPFLWQNGKMEDLNTLVARGFADSLVSAQDITDDGRITGALVERSTGRVLTYVAVPVARP